MSRQSVAYNLNLDDFVNKHPNLDYGEISGIKLRDSLFVVYSGGDSVLGSEFIYNLKSMDESGEMVFDINMNATVSTGESENCGVYRLEDGRILLVTRMKDWQFNGYIFKDDKEWIQYSEFLDRNSVDG